MPVQLRGYVVEQTTDEPPILNVLGAGSFGVVVKATNLDGEAVALKIMGCEAFDGTEHSIIIARKERDTLRTIGPHPNITQLKGWEELEPTDPSGEAALAGPLMQGIKAWMRAELKKDPKRPMPKHWARTHTFCIAALELAGETELFDHLITHGRVSAESLRPVTKQLAEALKHVHSHGFGHFDVKLENIRIVFPPGTGPVVTLVDFGLAVDRPTKTGTLGIAAPEFFTSQVDSNGAFTDVDKEKTGAADIFSFGIVVFSLAFGNPPWAQASAGGEAGGRLTDQFGRGFQKYASLGEPGRLLAYCEQTPAFKGALSPPALAAPALPAPTPMATGPTLPTEDDAGARAAGAPAPPTLAPAPSDPRLIDLLSKMLQIAPANRLNAQEILGHHWITHPVTPAPAQHVHAHAHVHAHVPAPVPAPPAPSVYSSCSAAGDAAMEYTSCGAASDAEPPFTSGGATAPVSASYRSLGESAPPDTELVLPKLTRTHALMAIEEGWAFAE